MIKEFFKKFLPKKKDKPNSLHKPEQFGTCVIEFWTGLVEENTIVVLRHPDHVKTMEWLDANMVPNCYAKETLVDENDSVIIDDITNKPVILYFYKSPENSAIPNWICVAPTLEAVKVFYKEKEAEEMEKNVYKVTTTFFLRENDTSKESIEERIQSWGVLSVLGKASEIHSSVEAIHKNCCPTAIDFDDVPTRM
jgi:hypothetical protein